MDNEQERPHQDYIPTSTGGLYNFLVWALLITYGGSPELLAIREPQQDNKPKYPHLFFIWVESKK